MKNLERVAQTGGPNGWPKQPHGFSRRVKQEPQKSDALAGYTACEIFERVNVNGITGYVIIQKAYGT